MPACCNSQCIAALTLIITTVFFVTCQIGCEGKSTAGQSISPAIGNMTDTSYYGHRGKTFRPNANGQMICFDQFEDHFLWVDYAAPWCSTCEPQTAAIREVESSCSGNIVFLTVMTSDDGGYGDPATRQTAKRWSAMFQLDPSRVVAADLTATTVPKHILFSPDGQVLFEQTGQMNANEIRQTLARCRQDWQSWKSSTSSH